MVGNIGRTIVLRSLHINEGDSYLIITQIIIVTIIYGKCNEGYYEDTMRKNN